MTKAIMIYNLDIPETEGIYKKILSEAKAIQKYFGNCLLIGRSKTGTKILELNTNSIIESPNDVISCSKQYLLNNGFNIIYIRHMIPSFKLIDFLKTAKENGSKVYYEIPTYPYYGEQFNNSNHKIRTSCRLLIDTLFWPLIYRYIFRLVVIKSNSKVRMFNKMTEITNGVDTDVIKSKEKYNSDKKTISMVAVGTIYSYHGYDRILKGLKKYNENTHNIKVSIHFIGKSKTMNDLETFTKQKNVSNVFFHGIKTTEELNDMYDMFDIGLGCLALHRRNADIDTTLKIIEYYCRGVPVVSSGFTPMDSYNEKFTFKVSNSDSPINIQSIVDWYINLDDFQKISDIGKLNFSWNKIIEDLFLKDGINNDVL